MDGNFWRFDRVLNALVLAGVLDSTLVIEREAIAGAEAGFDALDPLVQLVMGKSMTA
jgi:hypothetical protein